MTKAQEIDLLRSVAAQFGPHSYCGPWLESIADEVAGDMRNDFPPAPTVHGTRDLCARMISVAQEEAARIVADAESKAQGIMDRAEKVRDEIGCRIRRAAHALDW